MYKAQRYRNRWLPRGRLFVMRSKGVPYPLWCRSGTSDMDCFRQVFVERQYSCLDDVHNPELILDCGANIGYATIYFLSRFANAQVIAIEPELGNFQMLAKNVAPFGDRVELINSGVWSHPANLVLAQEKYGEGREWSKRVREAKPGEIPVMIGVDIGQLLDRSGHSRISILKMDIERAEYVLFSANVESWIGRVDNIAIELHDEECLRVFQQAVAGIPFEMTSCGELMVCKRQNSRLRASAA
jgi:FkbM family methyltransferase